MPENNHPTVRIREPERAPLFLVVHGPLEIGRDCNGLLLSDSELSRRHLRLTQTGGLLSVEDLGSTNGTAVDGEPVLGPTTVRSGQRITFGRCELAQMGTGVDDARPTESNDSLRATSIQAVAQAAAGDPLPVALARSGTLTIVFSDIEQSTERGNELGDAKWVELLAIHNAVVRRQVERHGGHEIKALGDGFMLAFASARDAVQCSIEIQRALRDHARSRPVDAVRVRIGMHAGEAIVDDGDLFGRPVVLAARIADQARGGEILVSSLVREIVESRGDLTFDETREAEMKGIDGTHSLHRVDWESHVGDI